MKSSSTTSEVGKFHNEYYAPIMDRKQRFTFILWLGAHAEEGKASVQKMGGRQDSYLPLRVAEVAPKHFFDGCPQNLLQASFQPYLGHPQVSIKMPRQFFSSTFSATIGALTSGTKSKATTNLRMNENLLKRPFQEHFVHSIFLNIFYGCPQNLLQGSFKPHLGHPPILTKNT